MDRHLLFLINRQWTNPVLDWLMAIMTNFDLWRPLLFILIPLLLWRGGFRWRAFIVVTLVSLGVADGIFTQFTKFAVNRPRPAQALEDVREVALIRTHPQVLAINQAPEITYSPAPSGATGGRSFPSGHALNNSLLATLAILFFGWRGAWYILPAALIAYSRIYCGSHWPSDVLVSAFFGVGWALVCYTLLAYLYRKITARWFPRFYLLHPELVPSATR
ncbi:MAG: phosphatase PAP2 family protein [Verrucomicrobia bacterium]|jgi:undecaprenyl-diphosphatase|nr:phosphatase PAP2 family protein [Verrucomicrobiota bacterium]MBV9274150.1 phosphatase PAP2 family protein [Verrucomicrobiota bacterium]